MSRTLVVHLDAAVEIEESAVWYDTRHPGLGLEFLAELDRIMANLTAMPASFPI